MKTKMMVMVALLVIVGVWSGGCHGPYTAKSDQKEALEHTETVTLMDKDLRKWIRIDGQQASYTDNGRLQAYCEIRNIAKKNLIVMVQTVFKDENGIGLDDMTNWETVTIPSGAIHYYKATSMSNQARRYGIRIKLGGR